MTPESAGFDLFAAVEMEVPPTRSYPDGRAQVGRALVPTGVIIQLPPGTVGRVGSRSGLSVNSNIEAGAGWIDSDYRGEVMVELKNLGAQPFKARQGQRIAQLIVMPLAEVEVRVLADLAETHRGEGGFGSTGR